MNQNLLATPGGEVVVYAAPDGEVRVDVRLERETVWLSLTQMAELFGRDKSVISRHVRNVFKSGELERRAVVAKNATVQREGDREVVREIEYLNLDAIVSVGYRVNSKSGTQFRICATRADAPSASARAPRRAARSASRSSAGSSCRSRSRSSSRR